MTVTEAQRRFAAAPVARLGTVTGAGDPHLVPIAFAVAEDGTVVTAVDAKPKRSRDLRRVANIRLNPQSSLLVDHYANEWEHLWWVRCDGTGMVFDATTRLLEPLVAKYPQYGATPPPGPVVVITPHRWQWWTADGT